MERALAVTFSLPQYFQGEQAAEGLCTVALANAMADAHNEVRARARLRSHSLSLSLSLSRSLGDEA